MKLSSWLEAEALIGVRNHLLSLKDEGRIEISINGHHQNREFVGQVEQGIRLELRCRIRDIDERLQDLGIVID